MFHFEWMVKATQQNLKEESFRIIVSCSGIRANSLSLQDVIPSWIQNGVPTKKGLWGSLEMFLGKTPKNYQGPLILFTTARALLELDFWLQYYFAFHNITKFEDLGNLFKLCSFSISIKLVNNPTFLVE